jgi:hypothetical protein
MIIDAVDVDDLSLNREEAFIAFEERLRVALAASQAEDRRNNSDGSGYYTGSYSPERYYVSSVLAFLDEYELELDVRDITYLSDDEFRSAFDDFFNRINYVRTRFKLRKARLATGQAGTVITINPHYKEEIHSLLNTVRKIVNANIQGESKKDLIYRKIAALESEVDRDRTTIDAVFGRFLELSRVVGRCAENLEPLVQKLERVMAALRNGAEPAALLPKPQRTQLLPTSKPTLDQSR